MQRDDWLKRHSRAHDAQLRLRRSQSPFAELINLAIDEALEIGRGIDMSWSIG